MRKLARKTPLSLTLEKGLSLHSLKLDLNLGIYQGCRKFHKMALGSPRVWTFFHASSQFSCFNPLILLPMHGPCCQIIAICTDYTNTCPMGSLVIVSCTYHNTKCFSFSTSEFEFLREYFVGTFELCMDCVFLFVSFHATTPLVFGWEWD